MGYNAGTKVRIAHGNGTTVMATITGHGVNSLMYRDGCKGCEASKLHRHVLNPDTSRIL